MRFKFLSKKAVFGVSREYLAKVSTTNLGKMNRETREIISSYEKLFTLLQTEPEYLAKLLFCMTVVKSTSFMQSVVFATYDWAQNKREEYLLLKLFKSALQEEIKQKVKEPKDLLTTNALVVKLIVNFYRGIGMSVQGSNSEQTGKASLRDILGEQVSFPEIYRKNNNFFFVAIFRSKLQLLNLSCYFSYQFF